MSDDEKTVEVMPVEMTQQMDEQAMGAMIDAARHAELTRRAMLEVIQVLEELEVQPSGDGNIAQAIKMEIEGRRAHLQAQREENDRLFGQLAEARQKLEALERA